MAITKEDIELPNSDTVAAPVSTPLTFDELVSSGKTAAQAHEILHKRVFGAEYTRDDEGRPIETGHGSVHAEAEWAQKHPGVKSNHQKALELENQRAAKSSGVAQADVIAAAVAAGVQAGLKAAKEQEL